MNINISYLQRVYFPSVRMNFTFFKSLLLELENAWELSTSSTIPTTSTLNKSK